MELNRQFYTSSTEFIKTYILNRIPRGEKTGYRLACITKPGGKEYVIFLENDKGSPCFAVDCSVKEVIKSFPGYLNLFLLGDQDKLCCHEIDKTLYLMILESLENLIYGR